MIILSALCGLTAAILIRQARRLPAPGWHLAVTASVVFFLVGLVLLWQGMRSALAPVMQ